MSDRLKAAFARPQKRFIKTADEALADLRPGSAVELLVSLHALHELLVEPGLPLADDDALRGYAQQQFSHYFGAAAQRFALAPWRVGAVAGASALHGIDLTALQAQAATAGVRIAAVRPVWAAWLASLPASVRASSGRLHWIEGEQALVIELERGRITALQPRRIADPAELGDALATGGPSDSLTAQSGPAVPQPDFTAQPARSPLAWPLAATGLVVLATALWSGAQSHLGLKEARAQRDRVASLKPAAAPTRTKAAEPENRTAREARTLLAAPWEATLSRVETTGAEVKPVAWLGLDASASRGELKLEGLTSDKLAALQLAETLGTTPGWGQVVLSRFSQAETGLVGQRFEITAKVKGAGS